MEIRPPTLIPHPTAIRDTRVCIKAGNSTSAFAVQETASSNNAGIIKALFERALQISTARMLLRCRSRLLFLRVMFICIFLFHLTAGLQFLNCILFPGKGAESAVRYSSAWSNTQPFNTPRGFLRICV